MSKRDDHGGRPPSASYPSTEKTERSDRLPVDDRTLLDPLSVDELEALREARRHLKKSSGGKAAAGADRPRQMVIGPDEDESLGTAPTRAMPALPSFDGRVSLDQIGAPATRPSGPTRDPAATSPAAGSRLEHRGAAPSEPMSVYQGTVGNPPLTGDEPTITPGSLPPEAVRSEPWRSEPPRSEPPRSEPPEARSPGSKAGPTGFGENTLMWMTPPKPAPAGPTLSTTDMLAVPSAKESTLAKLKTFGMVAAVALIIAGLAAATLFGGQSGVIELHTQPSGAAVAIDGKPQTERTPMKLTMAEGLHTIDLSLEGYEGKTIEVVVDPERPGREEVTLVPKSAAGLMTVTINVQPVAAMIEVDGQKYPSKRSLNIPNVDPRKAHTIVVEAPGYQKVEQRVAAAELKSSYTFALQPDPGARPE